MFKSLLEEQVQNAFKIMGQVDGLAPNQTFVESSTSTYDTSTRTYTSGGISHTDVPMVLARFTVDERDDEVIVTTDFKALIAALDLPVAPKIDDHILTAAGDNYMVVRLLGVPGESLHILHIRKTE
jgi:hypothetical protein